MFVKTKSVLNYKNDLFRADNTDNVWPLPMHNKTNGCYTVLIQIKNTNFCNKDNIVNMQYD